MRAPQVFSQFQSAIKMLLMVPGADRQLTKAAKARAIEYCLPASTCYEFASTLLAM